jgi:CTP synthase
LKHASYANNLKLNIKYIDSEQINPDEDIKDMDGIVIPGGFGIRGIEGMIRVVSYCRRSTA